MTNNIVTQKRLKELLHYDPDTGIFHWLVRRGNQKAGNIAGTNCRGRIRIAIDGVDYLAHRLAFLYMLNKWPKEVDHIKHVPHDNRWEKLRDVSHRANQMNMSLSKGNTSGTTGISYRKDRSKWRAFIKVKGVYIHLGHFAKKSGAAKARKIADIKYGFHENHGD